MTGTERQRISEWDHLAGPTKVTDRRPNIKMRMDAKGTSERLEAERIRLLGGFEVMVGARTIQEGDWRLRKAANLIKLLALASGNRLHREQIMYTLWPNLGSVPPPTRTTSASR
jgi:two-component SAPR family response regulator